MIGDCIRTYLLVPEAEVVTGFSVCREKLSGRPRFALGGIGGAARDPPPPLPLLPAAGSDPCGCVTGREQGLDESREEKGGEGRGAEVGARFFSDMGFFGQFAARGAPAPPSRGREVL